MNSFGLFVAIFITSGLLLIFLIWFFGLWEWRRFLSYGFPEAWRDYLEKSHPTYKDEAPAIKQRIEKELLLVMGKLDFETSGEHFTIGHKIQSALWIMEKKIDIKLVVEDLGRSTRQEGQILYFNPNKKNEER